MKRINYHIAVKMLAAHETHKAAIMALRGILLCSKYVHEERKRESAQRYVRRIRQAGNLSRGEMARRLKMPMAEYVAIENGEIDAPYLHGNNPREHGAAYVLADFLLRVACAVDASFEEEADK